MVLVRNLFFVFIVFFFWFGVRVKKVGFGVVVIFWFVDKYWMMIMENWCFIYVNLYNDIECVIIFCDN